jgi:hypothetical protein
VELIRCLVVIETENRPDLAEDRSSVNPINRDRLAFVVCTLEISLSNISPVIGYRVCACGPKDKGADSPEIGPRTLPFDSLPVEFSQIILCYSPFENSH